MDDDSSGLRKLSKELTKERERLYRNGRLGMIIDGTGHNFSKIQSKKKELEDIGYDTYMVMVNTSLEAQKRNQLRDRVLPPKLLEKSWKDVQKNLGSFQSLFKNNFVIVDNSKHLNDEESREKKFVPLVTKVVRKFVSKPIKNKLGKKWVEKQKLLNRRK